MIERRRFDKVFTLKDRLAQEIEHLRDQAKNIKFGVALDQVLQRIQQNRAAVDLNKSLESPGASSSDMMSDRKPFASKDWIVPPVLVPLGMAILVLAAIVVT